MNHGKYLSKCDSKYADGGVLENAGNAINRAVVDVMDAREQKGRMTNTRPPREAEGPPTKVQAGWDRYVRTTREGGDTKKAAKEYEDSQK